ncbi:DUF3011 domain-containing protein [Lysobacter sp. MMG2]|uniref:DUF3011 domain-containing protein n=1 Tax=Lysobacter sp. MMG2 TaxID=2801338 RepID=UPI001C247552|nr:DUF3011 domain-containing protein [Lysobacter sp. MMG2]MBU8974722.1 DUF3011 domain-containing protein [Lysobacter sp. MMG2]
MTAQPLRGFGILATLALAALWAPSAFAQYESQGYGAPQTVRCDSNDNRYRQCPIDGRGARLVRQYSKSACVEGRTWGVGRGFVWVNGGCRAEFASGGGWNGGGGNGGDGRTVRCDSNDNRYRQCAIDGRGARLVRQYSKSPCVEGRSWGVGRGFVWVNDGCRAEFASGSGWGGGNGGGWGGGDGGGHGGGWNNPGQTLYCGSDDNRPRRCNVTVRRDARLVRQASKAACVEGRSWGWDNNGVWVSNGCRGDFQVY